MDELIAINGEMILNPATAQKIIELEKLLKTIKSQEDEMKKTILAEMEKNKVYQIETQGLLITYVDAFERESLDTKRLRKENPDVYDEFVRFSPVKPSLRITLR